MSAASVVLPRTTPRPTTARRVAGLFAQLAGLVPGLLLCLAVTGAAVALERLEAAAFGATWLEALVLAILVGTAVRTAWSPGGAGCRASRSAPRPCWRSRSCCSAPPSARG